MVGLEEMGGGEGDYDRSNVMFAPDGRLRQVEYATKTAKRGSPIVGVVCKDGVLLCVYKGIENPLRISRKRQKLVPIDDHLVAGVCGIISDGGVLIDRAQLVAQRSKMESDSPVDVKEVIDDICSIKQSYTQFGGLRPFGVSIIFAGIDETGMKLYASYPSGIYAGYYAVVLGEQEDEFKKLLEKWYDKNMTMKRALSMCLKMFKTVWKEIYNQDMIQAVAIPLETKKFEWMDVK